MSKDAYYFPHDSNARNDPKILALRSVYGSEGYGWYWIIIEMLREQSNYKIKINKYVWNALAMQLQCSADAVKKFVETCVNEFGLLQSDDDFFWSDSLIGRMKKYDEKSQKARKAAQARWNKPNEDKISQQIQSNCNADAMQPDNARNASKVEESKLNNSKSIKDYTSEIKRLLLRYPDGFQDLNTAYWNAMAETRLSKRIQESVICKTIESWSHHPVEVVEYALKRHLEISSSDKNEKYTLGIMRKTTKEEAIDKLDRMKPKGGRNGEISVYDNLF